MDKTEFEIRTESIKLRLYKMAVIYLQDESAAVEAVSETIYKALKGIKKLREEQYFETWITRILINECKKEIKRLKKVKPDSYAEVKDYESFDYNSLPLKQAIGKLPEELKNVIILRYFADYTLSEVANMLDMPQGTVVTRQRKALSLLRLELEVENYE